MIKMLINFHVPHLEDYLHQTTLEMHYLMEKKAKKVKKVKKEKEPLQEFVVVVKVLLHILKMYHHLTLLCVGSKSFVKLVFLHEYIVWDPFPIIMMDIKD